MTLLQLGFPDDTVQRRLLHVQMLLNLKEIPLQVNADFPKEEGCGFSQHPTAALIDANSTVYRFPALRALVATIGVPARAFQTSIQLCQSRAVRR